MKRIIALTFAGLLAISLAAPAFADGESGSDSSAMVGKIQRGAVNVLTGVLEIPAQIQKEWEGSENGIRNKTFATVGGVFKGIGMAVVREVGGVFEILTFPIGNGETLIEPETVFDNWK